MGASGMDASEFKKKRRNLVYREASKLGRVYTQRYRYSRDIERRHEHCPLTTTSVPSVGTA